MTTASQTRTNATASRYDALRALISAFPAPPQPNFRGVAIPDLPTDDTLNTIHPDSIQIMIDLLSSGSMTGRALACATFRKRFLIIHSGKTNAVDRDAWIEDPMNMMSIEHDDFALMHWSAGNFAEDAGMTDTSSLQLSLLHMADNYRRFRVDGAVLMGHTALHLCSDDNILDSYGLSECDDFIRWASGRDDLGRIVRIVRERKTIAPDALESFLELQSHVNASLEEGVL